MSVLSLDDAKTHLNVTTSANDAELTSIIDAAEAAITARVGPLEPTVVTARVPGGSSLVLPVIPAISLTSITPYGGTALTLDASYYLDVEAGTVTYAMHYLFGYTYYDVVYVAGRTTCPPDLLLAVKELVRHLWKTQRGGMQLPGSQPSDALSTTLPGSAYTFPIRVEQLIAPHERLGFA
jgi:hypothetical protein